MNTKQQKTAMLYVMKERMANTLRTLADKLEGIRVPSPEEEEAADNCAAHCPEHGRECVFNSWHGPGHGTWCCKWRGTGIWRGPDNTNRHLLAVSPVQYAADLHILTHGFHDDWWENTDRPFADRYYQRCRICGDTRSPSPY